MKKLLYVGVLVLSGCVAGQQRSEDGRSLPNRPDWVASTKVNWIDGDLVMLRSQYTVRGDERLNGCYQLARLEAKEALLREISEDLRGQIDTAQEGLSENAELALTQVRSSEFKGKVTGMRFTNQFDERYTTSGVERIDCYLLSAIKKTDYDNIKRQVLYKIAEADPEIKKAIKTRAVKFFEDKKDSAPDMTNARIATEPPAKGE